MKHVLQVYLSFLIFISCNFQKPKEHEKVFELYSKRAELIDDFNNLSIIKRGNLIIMTIYQPPKENQYFFEKQTVKAENNYVLVKDTLQFELKSFPRFGILYNFDSANHKRNLESFLSTALGKMNIFGIDYFTSEFYKQGVNLKFHLTSKDILYYVTDTLNIANIEWKKYVNQSTAIDQHWFYNDN